MPRRSHYDVTNTIRVSHPQDVAAELKRLFTALYPQHPFDVLDHAIALFGQLYAGRLPGYAGCDTWYHDAQHSLDCTLAMARLIDGHERSMRARERLGPRRAVLGLVVALFHDAGYIRRDGDRASNGAEYTLTHVHRGGEFLRRFLPALGLARDAALAGQLVHFTGYEMTLDAIRVDEPRDRRLGFMLGTADLMSQTADRCYAEKCRDFLFREFQICGLAGERRTGISRPRYRTPEQLLERTVAFNRRLWRQRIDGYFCSVHRYFDVHFGGEDPYKQAIAANLARITLLRRHRQLQELRWRPVAINRNCLPDILQAA